jgi:hypothetical protein
MRYFGFPAATAGDSCKGVAEYELPQTR